MGDDAGEKAKRVADLMQVIAKLTHQCLFGARTGQKSSVGRQGINLAKESETVDEFTHKGIHGDHTFGFEFAEWHMNRPLPGAAGAKTVVQSAAAMPESASAHCSACTGEKAGR
jgi:hypothetical protein